MYAVYFQNNVMRAAIVIGLAHRYIYLSRSTQILRSSLVIESAYNRVEDQSEEEIAMNRTTNRALLMGALLILGLFSSGCTNKEGNPIPPSGTRVTTISDVLAFKQAAKELEGHCGRIGGCTCFLDGIQSSCSLVFACLDAGFCELARE